MLVAVMACICLLVLSVGMVIYGIGRLIYEYKIHW